MMKAYIITGDDGYSIVVFAESRGKAASIAKSDEYFCDYDFTEIKPRREHNLDKYCRGVCKMDWYDPQDRIALCKEGWSCLEPEERECQNCPAQRYCEHYLEKEEHDES